MLSVKTVSCFSFQARPSNQAFKEGKNPHSIYRALDFEFSLSPKYINTHTVNFLRIPLPCGRPLFPVHGEVRGLDERGAPLHLLSPAKKEKPWHSKAVFSSSLSEQRAHFSLHPTQPCLWRRAFNGPLKHWSSYSGYQEPG